MNRKKLFTGILLVSVAAGAIDYGTNAFFSDTEKSQDNILGAGSIDLKIGNESYYNGTLQKDTTWHPSDLNGKLFFNFTDLKPGDLAEDTIAISVKDNPSWICANLRLTSNDENTINDPEKDAGDTTTGKWKGELDKELNFVFWSDDGDNVFETDEIVLMQGSPSALPHGDENNKGQNYPIVDSVFNAFGDTIGTPLPGDTEKYIGKAWCFGKLVLNPVNKGAGINPGEDPGFMCDGTDVTNISQTDKITGDLTFSAIQSRNNKNYKCISQEDFMCKETKTAWASKVESFLQGKRKDGSKVLADRSNTNFSLGESNSHFYSLGFGGFVIIEFSDKVYNLDGEKDISIHEITNGRDTYPEEKALIEVSQDGTYWKTLGTATNKKSIDGKNYFELTGTGFTWISYVRITDTTSASIHANDADGFDIDAVGAYVCDKHEDREDDEKDHKD